MKEILEQIRTAIKDGHPQETTELVNTALASGVTAKEIVDDGMLSAMKDMSEFFKNGDSDIPRILAAARCIRKGFELIEQDDRLSKQPRIGKVILGTVEGDLHDVGKNLVALMFRSVGFEVIDLGVDISEKQFLKAIRENPEVSIVCLSSLLNTSIPEMAQVVKSLRRNSKRTYKILVGGGAVTRELAEQMRADAYTETAADCASLAKELVEKQSEGAEK